MKGPLHPDDPRLIQRIKDEYLIPPSTKPYSLSYNSGERNPYISGIFIGSVVKDFFKNKHNGFFVEAGALDGEFMSHTLELELKLGWRGLLVEPDLSNFSKLKTKNRRAWLTPTCFSLENYPEQSMMTRHAEGNGKAALIRGTGRMITVRKTNIK